MENFKQKVLLENSNYLISLNGVIKNRFTGRTLKAIQKSNGYLVVNLVDDEGLRTQYYIHRLMLTNFVGVDNERPHCDHINRVRNDNRLENLRWVTPKENSNNRKDNVKQFELV